MKDWATLLTAIASLLWPIFAFALLIMFRTEIRSIAGRLNKLKVFGQEVELADDLKRLEATAAQAVKEVAALPDVASSEDTTDSQADDDFERQQREMLVEAANSPRAALMLLSASIERETRLLLASRGLLKRTRPLPLPQAIQLLDERGALLRHLYQAVSEFWSLRSRIVHGHEATAQEILRAIDYGSTILQAVRSVPRDTHHVMQSDVPIFSDEAGTERRDDVVGVSIATRTPEGAITNIGMYPTTQTHFHINQIVAWEWASEKSWGPSWYRDPASAAIKVAWTSSSEFVGRPLRDL